jgi:hypothetical protein
MDLLDDVEIECPHCGEMFAISVDTAFPLCEMIEDCAVCCRPMQLLIRCSGGEIDSIDVSRA